MKIVPGSVAMAIKMYSMAAARPQLQPLPSRTAAVFLHAKFLKHLDRNPGRRRR